MLRYSIKKLRRTICHKTSSNFLFLRFRLLRFRPSSNFFTSPRMCANVKGGRSEAYWLTIILKRFTWARKAASRAVKCANNGEGCCRRCSDTQIRGKFMEIWVRNWRHHHFLRLISDSSVRWCFRGRGCVFSGFRRVIVRESQPSSERCSRN